MAMTLSSKILSKWVMLINCPDSLQFRYKPIYQQAGTMLKQQRSWEPLPSCTQTWRQTQLFFPAVAFALLQDGKSAAYKEMAVEGLPPKAARRKRATDAPGTGCMYLGGRGRSIAANSKPVWNTDKTLGQPGLYNERLSQSTTKHKQ